MGENEKSFIQFVGRVLFPRDPGDLRNSMQCPACFTPLRGSICHSCQLDLNHPAALQLAAASKRAADALDERLEIIGRMRYETDQLVAERAARVDAAAAAPAPPPSPAPAVAPAAAATATATMIRPPSTDGSISGSVPAAPRRSTVQVLLVVVGVSLLAIFAIFGLVWAFINYGVAVRSVIIGTITLAAVVTASLLHRRKLVATGEGIAALGVVLVYLDVWAVRVNDFFGLAASNGSVYWGSALLVTSLVFLAWHRLSSMRVPSVAAHAALVPAVGLLTAGLLSETTLDSGSVAFLAGLAAAISGLVHRITVSSRAGAPERILLLTATSVALLLAAGAAWAAAPLSDWAAAFAVVGVAAVALAHGYSLISLPGSTPAWHVAAAIFTGFGALQATLAAPAVAVRTGETAIAAIAPGVAAVVIALAFESGWRRMKSTAAGPSMLTGAITAATVAAVAAIASTIAAIIPLGDALARVQNPWSLSSFQQLVAPSASATQALIGVAAVVAALGVGWALLGALPQRGHLLMYAAAVVVMLAVLQLRGALPIALGYALAGAVALGLLVFGRALPRNYRLPLVLLLAASATVSYAVGWVDRDAWWATVASTTLLLAASRSLSRDASVRATLLGGAVVTALTGVAGAGVRLAQEGAEFPPYALMALVAALLILMAAPRLPLLSGADRQVVFWIAAVTGIAAVAPVSDYWSAAESGLSGAGGMALSAAAVLVGFLVWLALPSTAGFRPTRIVAGLAVAPLAGWSAWNAALAFDMPQLGVMIAPVIAVVLVNAGALALHLVRREALRWPADAGAAVVAVPVVGASLVAGVPELWLVLLLAAAALLLASASRDGIVGSASDRKQLGWGSLALATSALWLRLAESSVDALEPYVLPLAGMLLLIGLLSWRVGERTHLGHPSRGAPPLLASGLLVAIVPLAVVSGSDPLARPLIVGGVSALLLLVGTLTRENADVQPYLNAVGLAGGSGVVLVAGARAYQLLGSTNGAIDARLEAWVVPAAILLVAAAVGLSRSGASEQRLHVAQALVLALLVALAAVESIATNATTLGSLRAVALVLLLSAVHVLAFWSKRPPFTDAVAWTALGLAALSALGFIMRNLVEPFEWVVAPVALALLATGLIQLRTVPTARSWPWLGPGLLVLFVPSLVALYLDEPLWRVIGLGVIATIVIVIGSVRRLQAPFLVGTVVLLVHLVTQLWPGIRLVYEAVPWWLWLGVAGVILIALAARYEHRIRNFRSVAMRIGALR